MHHGSEDAAKFLIEHGADVAAVTATGKTALHAAAARERAELCLLLLQSGAALAAQDAEGMSPLHEAAFRGHKFLSQRYCVIS